GCGAKRPAIDGPTHPYVGASSACWTQFGEVNWVLPPTTFGRLVVDAYMLQHPGVPERRSVQSVGVHLVGLCLVLEHGLAPGELSTMLQRILATPPEWRWLEPPAPNGELTIFDVAGALGTDDAPDACERYVRSIWAAWAQHHDTVEAWARGSTP
ncbi:MAG: DUF5946 family protein, partial [Candidatus Limnocylindrales bacterium]